MRVVITGGAGFIGSHLTEYHLARGDEVQVVDDLSTGTRASVLLYQGSPGYHFSEADILDWPELEAAVAGADRIYHMAAVVGMFRVLNQPIEVTRVNVLGTERVLQAMVKTGSRAQIVIPSSSSVYAHAAPDNLREGADVVLSTRNPLINYAASKLTNEIQGRAYAQEHELPVVIVRLFNAIGPRQSGMYGFVVPRFVQQALTGEPLTVFGDGTQTRSFCDVRDTVAMLDTLAGTPAAYGQVVNVGNDHEVPIRQLAELVKHRAGSASELQYVPFAKAYGQDFEQIPQRRPILDRLYQLTGYRHRWTLEQTVDDLIGFYRRQAPGALHSRQAPRVA
ncbi:MAG TPA: NAD-dependent epimerase/dehydratase family protein [Nevskiales bacterium]|nr:NAD-dependent epimerase/dehydratase family protein [Nevskiales bacterium]